MEYKSWKKLCAGIKFPFVSRSGKLTFYWGETPKKYNFTHMHAGLVYMSYVMPRSNLRAITQLKSSITGEKCPCFDIFCNPTLTTHASIRMLTLSRTKSRTHYNFRQGLSHVSNAKTTFHRELDWPRAHFESSNLPWKSGNPPWPNLIGEIWTLILTFSIKSLAIIFLFHWPIDAESSLLHHSKWTCLLKGSWGVRPNIGKEDTLQSNMLAGLSTLEILPT